MHFGRSSWLRSPSAAAAAGAETEAEAEAEPAEAEPWNISLSYAMIY